MQETISNPADRIEQSGDGTRAVSPIGATGSGGDTPGLFLAQTALKFNAINP